MLIHLVEVFGGALTLISLIAGLGLFIVAQLMLRGIIKKIELDTKAKKQLFSYYKALMVVSSVLFVAGSVSTPDDCSRAYSVVAVVVGFVFLVSVKVVRNNNYIGGKTVD